jgi:16S rRNA processing protein RimM
MTDRPEDLICLGAIAGAHGIKGEVKLKSFTEDPLGIGAHGVLVDEQGARQFELVGLKLSGKLLVARIAGVSDRNAAELLRGTRLCVPRSALPEPEDDGTYYQADLIGLKAVSSDGRAVGTVLAVQNYGAGDLLEVEPDAGGDTILVPFAQSHVPEVDMAKRQVVIAEHAIEPVDPD